MQSIQNIWFKPEKILNFAPTYMQSALLDRTIVHGWRNVTSETKVLDGLKDTAFQTAPDIRSVDSAELLAGPPGVAYRHNIASDKLEFAGMPPRAMRAWVVRHRNAIGFCSVSYRSTVGAGH